MGTDTWSRRWAEWRWECSHPPSPRRSSMDSHSLPRLESVGEEKQEEKQKEKQEEEMKKKEEEEEDEKEEEKK